MKIIKELKDNTKILICKIMVVKIDFKLSNDHLKKLQNIENLKKLLKDEKEDSNIALLNYELAIMNNELGRINIVEKHKKEAIQILQKLYKKTPKIDYKNKYEELEKL